MRHHFGRQHGIPETIHRHVGGSEANHGQADLDTELLPVGPAKGIEPASREVMRLAGRALLPGDGEITGRRHGHPRRRFEHGGSGRTDLDRLAAWPAVGPVALRPDRQPLRPRNRSPCG